MTKRIEIRIGNKFFYSLVLFLGIIVLGGIVYAILGSIPNPGHALSELQKCSDGQNLKMVNGNWACVSTITGNLASCRTRTNSSGTGSERKISCSNGEIATGGGCIPDQKNDNFEGNYPIWDQDNKPIGWRCDLTGTVYVICCKN